MPPKPPRVDANTIYGTVALLDRPCAPSMDGCPMGGACVSEPIDQAKVDQCPEC
jgi:hypothetical protein